MPKLDLPFFETLYILSLLIITIKYCSGGVRKRMQEWLSFENAHQSTDEKKASQPLTLGFHILDIIFSSSIVHIQTAAISNGS